MRNLSCLAKAFTLVSVSLILKIHVTLCVTSSSELTFMKMKPISDTFVRLSHRYQAVDKVSLRKCLIHCFNDETCKAVSYNARIKYCEMISKVEQNFGENSKYPSPEIEGWVSYYFAAGRCPAGWYHYHGSCYFMQTNEEMKVTWQSAEDTCILNTAHLVKIETEEENQFILAKLKELNVKEYESFWTAGNDQETEGVWVWGLQDPGFTFEYRDWAPTEPNDYNGIEDCLGLILTPTSDRTWNDFPCGSTFLYICEFPQ